MNQFGHFEQEGMSPHPLLFFRLDHEFSNSGIVCDVCEFDVIPTDRKHDCTLFNLQRAALAHWGTVHPAGVTYVPCPRCTRRTMLSIRGCITRHTTKDPSNRFIVLCSGSGMTVKTST